MVFLLQNTQYRDSEAIQIKLDELIRAMEGAHNALLELEELDEKDLDRIRAEYRKLAEKARKDLKKGKGDTGVPDVKTWHIIYVKPIGVESRVEDVNKSPDSEETF